MENGGIASATATEYAALCASASNAVKRFHRYLVAARSRAVFALSHVQENTKWLTLQVGLAKEAKTPGRGRVANTNNVATSGCTHQITLLANRGITYRNTAL
jgi:hypothetical protein